MDSEHFDNLLNIVLCLHLLVLKVHSCGKMQRGRRGRDPFFNFGDPFAGFGGFDDSFGGPRSLMSSFFGGRDPFDDPFFTSPFGGMPESNFFGSTGSPFLHMQPSTIIENQLPEPKRSRGPVIEELNSDDEKEEAVEEKKENPRKHGRSSTGPIVEDPHDVVEGITFLLFQSDLLSFLLIIFEV